MKVKARVLCLATYDAEIEVPEDWQGTAEEFVNEHIADLQAENLQFFDDLDFDDNRVVILERNR